MIGRKGGKKMKSINALLAALLLSGILGLNAAPVMAGEVDEEPESEVGIMSEDHE